MKKILVIDDELSMREVLKILLEKEGYSVVTATDVLIIFRPRNSKSSKTP